MPMPSSLHCSRLLSSTRRSKIAFSEYAQSQNRQQQSDEKAAALSTAETELARWRHGELRYVSEMIDLDEGSVSGGVVNAKAAT